MVTIPHFGICLPSTFWFVSNININFIFCQYIIVRGPVMDFTEIFIFFLGLLFALIVVKNYKNTTYMYAFKPLREQFQDLSRSLRYAGAPIKNDTESYLLLSDHIKGYPSNTMAKGPTSKQCLEIDWARNNIEKIGSYKQVTNNYKHTYPDTCNALNQDLILDFYKPRVAC